MLIEICPGKTWAATPCARTNLCHVNQDHLRGIKICCLDFMLNPAPVLLAESDPCDILLLRRAFDRARISNPLIVVRNGQQAIDYLAREGVFADRHKYPWPCLMLLDLKMPLVDGTQVLAWRKEHHHNGGLPIIVLTSLASPAKIQEIMDLGAADYRFKPMDFDGLVLMAQELRFSWLEKPVLSA